MYALPPPPLSPYIRNPAAQDRGFDYRLSVTVTEVLGAATLRPWSWALARSYEQTRRLIAEGEGVLSALLPELLVCLIDAIDEQTQQLAELTEAVRGLRQTRGR